MANIELVIKIPEEDYEYLKSHNKDGLYNAILNGIPLTKGHGRLIDANVLWEQMIKCGFHAVDMTVTEFIEDVLPTVIEAGEEVEE